MNRKLPKSLLLGIVLCILCTAFSACRRTSGEEVPVLRDPVTDKIGTITVVRGNLRDLMMIDAFIAPKITEQALETGGTVGEVFFMSGETVKKGDLLLKLDTFDLEKEIEKLKDELEFMETEADFDRQLYETDLAYKDKQLQANYAQGGSWQQSKLLQLDVEEIELKYQESLREYEKKHAAAEAALADAEERYEKSFLYAGSSGIVYYVDGTYQQGISGLVVKQGAKVPKDTTLLYIADESEKQIELEEEMDRSLSELPCFALIAGEEAAISLVPVSAEEQAEISALDRLLLRHFRITDRKYRDYPCGTFAPVFFVRASYEDVLYVPKDAVYRDSDLKESFVYRIGADGKNERAKVETVSCGTNAVILSGLEEGDELYVYR